MKHTALLIIAILFCSMAIAQSGKMMDPETIHKPTAVDTTVGPVIQLEVTINSILLLKLNSDSAAVTRDFALKRGSTLNITCISRSAYSAGVPEIYTKFNNEPERRYHQPVRLVARGHHTLNVRALTEGGGESSLKIAFTVKD